MSYCDFQEYTGTKPGIFSPDTGCLCFPQKITRFVLIYKDGSIAIRYTWWGHWKVYWNKRDGQRFVEAYVPEDANPDLIKTLMYSCHPFGAGVHLTKPL